MIVAEPFKTRSHHRKVERMLVLADGHALKPRFGFCVYIFTLNFLLCGKTLE